MIDGRIIAMNDSVESQEGLKHKRCNYQDRLLRARRQLVESQEGLKRRDPSPPITSLYSGGRISRRVETLLSRLSRTQSTYRIESQEGLKQRRAVRRISSRPTSSSPKKDEISLYLYFSAIYNLYTLMLSKKAISKI